MAMRANRWVGAGASARSADRPGSRESAALSPSRAAKSPRASVLNMG